jgi:hypothetical protein
MSLIDYRYCLVIVIVIFLIGIYGCVCNGAYV